MILLDNFLFVYIDRFFYLIFDKTMHQSTSFIFFYKSLILIALKRNIL